VTSALATDEAALPLDYDTLYEGYLASLVDNLRGFRAAAPGLELWVPDEDPLSSLRNLLDAASTVGRARLVVRLSAKTFGALGGDPSRLRAMAEPYGEARISFDGDAAILDVSGLDAPASRRAELDADSSAVSGPRATPDATAPRAPAAPPRDTLDPAAREAAVLAVYRPALEQAARSPVFRAALVGSPGRLLARGQAAAVELVLVVDPSQHRVVAAGFEVASSGALDLSVGLLESLCGIAVGLPVLEVAEHGTIRLERALRGAQRRPVAGIVLPESLHPLFRLARQLLTSALADYRRQTGFGEVHSRHDERPREPWLRASEAERRQWLALSLARALGARGLAPERASIESIRYDVRVELSLDLPPELDAPVFVTELERALQAEVDPRLEVYVTERRDRNAKRRLAVLGGEA
jgi:hypothetical protein